MGKAEKITDSEWKVMEIIWEFGPISSSDIIKKLSDTTDWNSKTIHTLISRLVKKEIAGIIKGRINLYEALIVAEESKEEVTDSFIKKIYNGSFELFVSNFIKNKRLSASEIEELKNILDGELNK